MGRSTRQQQQPHTQSCSVAVAVAKRPKDYSKQKLLRKKSVEQELLSTTRRRSTKLNAVMQMDPPGGRRRLGRNPIAEQQQQQQQQQDSSSSPTDADSSNEAGPGGSSGGNNSAECRRSSRKKTIKFDVRDLLNKNRKSHKIQIEARIDSNEPKIGAGQVSKAELDSKQKNFIEKSAIFRRFSISENKLPPRPPPPPGALIHTIQQCVGELEQLPLDGGELNLAAISPIARRLSRTQDILTASMMKPKQVSSLIVTKLESASTSKAAVAASSSASSSPAARRRMAVGGCVPSTSTAIPKKPQKRGRKPKAKLFSESTTESSSSNDGFESIANKLTPLQNIRSTEEVGSSEPPRLSLIDENSTTCIDLKENLDASAVTLPQPIILHDTPHNSTDDSFIAAQADAFTARVHSSDESTTGSLRSSPKGGRKTDEISFFGRSNSTETNSSEDSEKRRRKIRISVKRVSLTPQKSPLALSLGQADEPIEVLSSTNDENSNGDSIVKARKPKTKQLKGKQVEETCATPPIILLESDTSNAASVSSSVIEITSLGTPTNERETEQTPTNSRKGRNCKLVESIFPKVSSSSTQEMDFKPIQKSAVTQSVDVCPRYRNFSSRKSAPHLPIDTIAASSPSTIPEDDSQSEDAVLLSKEDEAAEDSNEKTIPQVRSLRSANSVQIKPTTPPAVSKRQKRGIKAQSAIDTPAEQDIKIQAAEMPASEVSKDDQLESVQIEELCGLKEGLKNSDSPEAEIKQSLRSRKGASVENENRPPSESDKEEQVTLSKQNRSRGLKKQEQSDDPKISEEKLATSVSNEEQPSKTDEKTEQPVVQEEEENSKSSERDSTNESEDRSSTDTTNSDRRRETLRSRNSALPIKKETSKKISKPTNNSSTPDSSSESSECPEKITKNRRQNVIDDKSKEETSSLCSETSSIASSASSSSASASASASASSSSSSKSSSTSSSSSNSSSSSSSSSRGRGRPRSSKNSPKVPHEQQPPQVEALRNKSPVSPGSPNNKKTQSNKSDSESSENFSKTDNIKFDELDKLRKRRKSMRLQRSSSEPDRDSEESESSPPIRHTSKVRSGRSRGRAERSAELRKKLPIKPLRQDLVPSGLEVEKIPPEETTPQKPNEQTDVSTANQENKTENPRAKSKKRTRRFVPIKYSSSESGTLSDEGNTSVEITSMRLTRTRRKTISSASEIEDIPLNNLSPPDCALEYRPRKSKQAQSKTQELLDTNPEELKPDKDKEDKESQGDTSAKDVKYDTNTEEESTPKIKPKVIRSRKPIRNSSKDHSEVRNEEDSTDAPKESETDQCSKDTEHKKELQHPEPASPSSLSSSDTSAVEGLVEITTQKKKTRSSLKTQLNDSGNEQPKDLESSLGNEERVEVEKDASVKVPDKSDLKNDKENKTKPQTTEEKVQTVSPDVLDSEVFETKSPKQTRKGTKLSEKSPISLKSKQDSKEQVVERKDEKIDEPTDSQQETTCETDDVNVSLPNEHSKDDLDKSTPKSSDCVPSPKFTSQEVKVPAEENKEGHDSKPTELEIISEPKKGTRLSLKKIETPNSENKSKELLVSDGNQTQDESMPLDVQVVKTPRQRKPTRFSAKSPEVPKVEEVQQMQQNSGTNHESCVQKEPDPASPRIKTTTRSSPKGSISNDIAVVEREEYQPTEIKANEPTQVAELKADTKTECCASLKSTNLEGNLVPEQSENCVSDALKSAETPKRKRKPTRFSPKSPDRPTIDPETVLKPLLGEKSEMIPNNQIDDTKQTEEPKSILTPSEPVVVVKSPRVRKGTRFSPKNTENLQIQSEQLTPIPIHVENASASQISDMFNTSLEAVQEKEITKPIKAKKGARILDKSSENQKIEEEIKKMLQDCQSAINDVTSNSSSTSASASASASSSSSEAKEQQEILKQSSLRTKKATRFSPQAPQAQDSSKPEFQTGALRHETTDNLADSKLADVSATSDDQINSLTGNYSIQMSHSQISHESPQEMSKLEKDKIEGTPSEKEDTFKCLDQTKSVPEMPDLNVSPSSYHTFKPEIATKKAIQKQLQSMLASLTSEPKPATPRRKRKTLGEQQEPIIPLQESSVPNKTDESNQEVDMKIISSDSSNPSDDSMKPQEGTSKIDPKQTPRRQLDSSFIESLEKSLLRPTSNKKISKKKEKDKEPQLVVTSPSKPTKEDTKKSVAKKSQEPSEELKKSESSSPKTKKKQPKESPKVVKKHSEDQTASTKRKSMVAAKAKELEETNLSDVLQDDAMDKQASSAVPMTASTIVMPAAPFVHKTKAETKFFSPDKRLTHDELPSSPMTIAQKPVSPTAAVKEKSPDMLPDPLKDIEKFIEDGVNLLKRSYKIDADDDGSLDRDTLKSDEMITPKKCKLDESVVVEGKQPGNSTPDDDNSNSNSESSTMTTNTSTSEVDTPNGIRRSHRIKNNSKSTKSLVGRGLVRERERFSMKDDEKTIYSIDDQKLDLAEVEAKNSKFLKDMEERLSNFRVIRENEYKCERVISKEAKRMLCDCFLTQEEEERGELGCGEDCLNRLLMIECGGDCTVRDRCTNRRFNKFLYSPCRVFRTEKKGFGIMADIEILPGEFIMEYVGEVINGDEFEFRINEYSKDKNKHYYFMALRSDAVIDATAKGNISRFINHSCDPNAETQKWTVNGELRIGFFSRKSIMPGEEITFDYQYQRYGKEAQKCYCESSNCRGWIGAEPSSEEEEEYDGVDEDESEETEEEETAKAVEQVPVIPSPIPPITDVANAEKQPLVPVVVTEVPAVLDVEMTPSLTTQPVTTPPTPLTEPMPTAAPEKPKELPPKKKKEKKRLLEEKLKPKQFLEDPDIEDEVRFLVKCGLRNQADTLRLSRLIVRAKLLETRINLLQILRQGELPCRRLFLDYHGLRLLHGWMSEVLDTRDTDKSMEIRMELLSALECLPISNKTMLTDSKVYQTVRDWSNNKESHSPSDGSPKEVANVNTPSASSTPPTTEDASSELQKLAAKLVHTWDNLPEVFRIPKRERIEQMKEHEREADRQYKVLERGLMSGSDENRNRERFTSKSGQKGRFKWSKDRERERMNERRKYAQNNSSGKDGNDKSAGSLAGESHLSKEQRRELFAAKVARDEAEKRQAEERREFDIKCRFFGLDPKRMRPENMPFCVNPSTGQWYSTDKKAISTPPSYAHVQVPVKPKSTNPADYRLPEMDLPPLWKFAISPKGKIYYYHVKIRIPQWEPPIKILPLAGQHNSEVKNSESDSSTAGINDSSEDDIEVIKGLDPVKLQAYIEKKIEDRRLQRYNRLVEEKPISPRKEEDRIYNQMEVRKYKENKEKIRKRKEEIRRRRDNIIKQASLDASNLSETTEAVESAADALPIQDYLLSSEEEDILKAECNNSPLIDKIVQGDKIVDELDALQRKRALKRALPIRDKYDHKKRKVDKNKESSKSTKRNKDGEGSSSSSKYRKVREKFRCEIAGIIVQHLKPYRDESCFTGKILTDDDFNHLARKLTHFVMVKELKYCESIGQTLIVTESVKNKSREFIKKYMAKYGKVYVRPKNDPEFKDIPFL